VSTESPLLTTRGLFSVIAQRLLLFVLRSQS
jgi:hypothetical protein